MKSYLKSISFSILIPAYILLFLLTACQKDPIIDLTGTPEVVSNSPKSFPNVDRELWPYFERFEIAAAEQGFNIDLTAERISGIIEDLEEEHVAGQCTFYSNSPNHVTIDTDFWRRSSENFKELIIFHELGHCSLDRDHREGQLENGSCISIMRSGLEPCRDAYNDFTKDFYLQELFRPRSVN